MATRRIKEEQHPTSMPKLDDLPEDGSPLEITSSFARRIGTSPAAQYDPEDYEDGEWHVHRQTGEGWVFIDAVRGRPYDPDLRESYGEGKYKIMPVGDDGRPVTKLADVRTIGSPLLRIVDEKKVDPDIPPDQQNMPAWMRMQLQQAAEERREARRREAEADVKRDEWERKQQEREYERQERAERAERVRLEQAEREREGKSEQMNTMMGHAVTLMTAFLSSQNQRSQPREMNDVLLSALIEDRHSRSNHSNSVRDNLELLVMLDKMAENRAAVALQSQPAKDEDDEGIMKTITNMLPALAMMKGGAGAAPAALAAPQVDPSQAVAAQVSSVLTDPDAIAQFAMANGADRTADAFVKAVKNNPHLEAAVIKAMQGE
jgi:hypothetical protein